MDRASFFVTGGSGCQGAAIVSLLLAKYPRASVISFSRSPKAKQPGVKYIAGDITSAAAVRTAIQETKPTVVFHCAGQMPSPGHRPMSYDELWENHYIGTKNVLDAAQESGVKAFVYTSSTSVVQKAGKSMAPVSGGDETWPMVEKGDGCLPYAEVKISPLLRQKAAGLKIVRRGRPTSLIHGPQDGIFPMWFHQLLTDGAAGVKLGEGDAISSITASDNGAIAHLTAVERLLDDPKGVAGEGFYISNPEPMPMMEWAGLFWRELDRIGLGKQGKPYQGITRTIKDPFGAEADEWLAAHGMIKFHAYYLSTDRWIKPDKAIKQLGYKPTISTAEGVRKTVEWYAQKLKEEGH